MTLTSPTVAFSTLACPEWSADVVVVRAAEIGYDAIEWRGGQEGHVSTAWSARRRSQLRRHMSDNGLLALAVTSYTDFVTRDAGARSASVEDLRRHVELAEALGARAVRAFVGIVDDAADQHELAQRAIDGFAACTETARAAGVAIAIEPHDDFATAASISPILERLEPDVVGAVWDIANTWGAGEDPTAGISAIGTRIRYVQAKDARWLDGQWQLTALGRGAVPVIGALRALAARGPLPPLSLEWERAWHPELDPPEIALPRELAELRRIAATASAAS